MKTLKNYLCHRREPQIRTFVSFYLYFAIVLAACQHDPKIKTLSLKQLGVATHGAVVVYLIQEESDSKSKANNPRTGKNLIAKGEFVNANKSAVRFVFKNLLSEDLTEVIYQPATDIPSLENSLKNPRTVNLSPGDYRIEEIKVFFENQDRVFYTNADFSVKANEATYLGVFILKPSVNQIQILDKIGSKISMPKNLAFERVRAAEYLNAKEEKVESTTNKGYSPKSRVYVQERVEHKQQTLSQVTTTVSHGVFYSIKVPNNKQSAVEISKNIDTKQNALRQCYIDSGNKNTSTNTIRFVVKKGDKKFSQLEKVQAKNTSNSFEKCIFSVLNNLQFAANFSARGQIDFKFIQEARAH